MNCCGRKNHKILQMQHNHKHPYQLAAGCVLLAVAVPLLGWMSDPSHLLPIVPTQFVFWHSVVEMLSMVVSMLVFVAGYRAILSARIGAVVLLGIMVYTVTKTSWQVAAEAPLAPTTAPLAAKLFSENGFILPVEIAAVLLLAAILGAIVIAREK